MSVQSYHYLRTEISKYILINLINSLLIEIFASFTEITSEISSKV